MSDRTKYTIETVGDKIEEFLDVVLDTMDFDVTYDLLDGDAVGNYFEKPTLVVKFEGPDVSYLMANKGEAMLALEQLTQEVLRMASDEHALLCFDANDYRLLRQQELRISAMTIAERVRETSTPYRFNPMTSRERRILHLALRDETDLRSESSGVGPHRHVVIYPAGMASLPEPPPPPPMRRPPPGGDRRDSRRDGDRRDGRRGGPGGGSGGRPPRRGRR
jgi:spoIIIJ-associated protein